MVSYRDVTAGFRKLDIPQNVPVIVHASLSKIGEIRGGSETVLGALLANYQSIMMPSFTFKTMIIPEAGPENNGIQYGNGKNLNQMAEFYLDTMPADKLMGILPETLRQHPQAIRSVHPILSFVGIGVEEAIETQTLEEPFAPILHIKEQEGWVILIGVDHTVNTSIHAAEILSGRKTFTRWALTTRGVYECPNYPGCSDGFNQIQTMINGVSQTAQIGNAVIHAIPLRTLVNTVINAIHEDPLALLCENPDCERCSAVRTSLL